MKILRFGPLLAFAGLVCLGVAGLVVWAPHGHPPPPKVAQSEADVAPYLLARYFGRKHFSVLYGLTWTAYAIGGATGPMVVGHFYDRAGSYQPRCIVGLACTTLLAAGLSLFLRRDRNPYHASNNNLASASISLEE